MFANGLFLYYINCKNIRMKDILSSFVINTLLIYNFLTFLCRNSPNVGSKCAGTASYEHLWVGFMLKSWYRGVHNNWYDFDNTLSHRLYW